MILVQQKLKNEERISVTPDPLRSMAGDFDEDRQWAHTSHDSDLCDDWHWDNPGCNGVRPAKYIRLSPAMFVYDDPFAEYQIPIPDSAYEYVGIKPDTGLHDNAITEVTDAWFNKDNERTNIQGST